MKLVAHKPIFISAIDLTDHSSGQSKIDLIDDVWLITKGEIKYVC